MKYGLSLPNPNYQSLNKINTAMAECWAYVDH